LNLTNQRFDQSFRFKLKQNNLEQFYLTFIRPILEYASEVWFNCSQFNSDRLEKVQIEAARIVCGFPSYASIASIYKETGWDFDLKSAKIGICWILRSNVFHSLIVEGIKDC
jgi:hypothetical protein